MRYNVDHKEHSRERILDSAAKQLRSLGTDAVRVVDVMQAAGLTHGGFYKHFATKDQLLSEAIQTALTQVSKRLQELTTGLPRPEALRKVIGFYLSEEHRMHPDLGCAIAAVGTEMARMPKQIKKEIGKALDAYADRLDYLMPGETADQRRAAFLVLFPSMAGCLMTARAHGSEKVRSSILSASRTFFEKAFCEGQEQQ